MLPIQLNGLAAVSCRRLSHITRYTQPVSLMEDTEVLFPLYRFAAIAHSNTWQPTLSGLLADFSPDDTRNSKPQPREISESYSFLFSAVLTASKRDNFLVEKRKKSFVANRRFAVLGGTSHSYGKGQICSWKFDLSNYISWLWYETLSHLIWSCMSTWLTQMEYRDPWSLSHHFTNATAVHNSPSKQGLPDQLKTQCTEFPFLSCMSLLFIPAGRHPMRHQASIFNNSKCKDTGMCNFTFKIQKLHYFMWSIESTCLVFQLNEKLHKSS